MAKKSKNEKRTPAPEEIQRILGVEWQTPVSEDSSQGGYVPIGKSVNEENVKK